VDFLGWQWFSLHDTITSSVDKKSNLILTGAIVGIIILVGGIVFFIFPKGKREVSAPSSSLPSPQNGAASVVQRAQGGIGEHIYEKSQNPLVDKLPETNPFGGNINPFEIRTNPYKDVYKNPFK